MTEENKTIPGIGEPWYKKKYNSPYPSVVTYRRDKNFVVQLKAMIDRMLSEAGHKLPNEFFDLFDDADDYLFESQWRDEENSVILGNQYQKLFNAISDTGKIALESEMQEIIKIVHEDFPGEELIAALEEISTNHYPEDIFIPFTDKDWEKVRNVLKENGISIDALSGEYGRRFHRMHREVAQTALNKYKK